MKHRLERGAEWHVSSPVSSAMAARLMLLSPAECMDDLAIATIKNALLENPTDFLDLVGKAHQLGSLIRFIDEHHLTGTLDQPVVDRLESFRIQSEILSEAHQTMLDELTFVANQLSIVPIVVKGLASQKLYKSSSERLLKDNDILVDRKDADVLRDVCRQLGYEEGYYNEQTREIVPWVTRVPIDSPRSYELPKMTKLVGITPEQNAINTLRRFPSKLIKLQEPNAKCPVSVELHFSLEPDKRIPIDLIPSTILPDRDLLELSPFSSFAYLAYKAYVDIGLLGEVHSSKLLADSLRILHLHPQELDLNTILPRLHETGLCIPVAYVLHHAVHTFGLFNLKLDEVEPCECFVDCLDPLKQNPLNVGDFIARLLGPFVPFDLNHKTVLL